MKKYIEYAKQMRYEQHQIPEIGFDLTKTLTVIRRKLGFKDARKHGGLPKPAEVSAILVHFAKMSDSFGMKMKIHGNTAEVTL